MMSSAIEELRSRPQWVCWRYEERRSKDGELRTTKVPYQPNGENASSTNLSTWSTYEACLAAVHRFDGIGYVLSADDPFTGIDLDLSLSEDGRCVSWAKPIVPGFASYTEVTPSGRGLRVWVRGALSGSGRSKNVEWGGKIEVYDRGRFFTVTEQVFEGVPETIEPRQGQLDAFMREQFPEKAPPVPRPPTAPSNLSDADHLEALLRSAVGVKVAALWRGETGAHGDDESAADLALCNYLRFEWGHDAAAIDRMFRQSGLMRDKWDTPRPGGTYGSQTIALALSSGDVRDPERGRRGRAVEPEPISEQRRNCTPPSVPPQGATPHTTEPGPASPPINNTDLGNARRLVARHGAELRFAFALGWLLWQSGRWREDQTGAVERRAKETVGSIYEEAARAESSDERKVLAAWAMKSESAGKIAAMIELARTEEEVCVAADAFDADPMLVNCENGTVVLPSGRFRFHAREDLLTKQMRVSYDPDATCPRWDQFLAEVTQGDTALAAYLQRAVGYSLTGDVREENLFFLYGLGANGKTTFLTVIEHLFGEYGTTAAPGLLLETKNEQHPTAIADLAGRRLVVCSEVGEGKRMAEELVKRLTGEKRQKGRKMHRDFFEFDTQYKLWLMANHKPLIKDTTKSIWRRIHTVPFTATFYEPEEATDGQPIKDPTLLAKLLAELPGILNWAIEGCKEWERLGLARPKAVLDATDDYRQEMDILGGFLSDCCYIDPEKWATAGALYAAYQEWCGRTGEHAVTQTAFGRALKERGFANELKKGLGRRWNGIGLLEETTKSDSRLGDG